MKTLENTTASPIVLKVLGLTIPALSTITIEVTDYDLAATVDSINEISPFINSEDIIVNDGIRDLIPANNVAYVRAIDFLSHPDTAFNQRFLAEPERSNFFVSKNVQEAIEEARATLQGKISVLPTFLNNGNTSNKWLALDGAFFPTDTIPAVVNFDSAFAAITYVNGNDNSDVDIEFYRNGTDPGDLIFTWEVRDARYGYKTDGLTGVTWTRGDTMACFARKVTPGGAASSVIVTVLVQSINSVTNEAFFPTLP